MGTGNASRAGLRVRVLPRFGARLRSLAVAGLALVCASLALSASASGLSQRGLALSGSVIGTPGSGNGQLQEPGAVAVNETTGDVYVVDRGNNRIVRFGPSGEFISAWGFGVSSGTQTYEVCTSNCKAGTGKGPLQFPGAIAVDNSSGPSKGAVYVVLDSRLNSGALWKFTSEGVKIKVIKQVGEEPKWEGALDGVAVDATGNLWVYRSGEEPTEGYVEGFDNKEEVGKEEGEKANEYRELDAEATLESEALIARKEAEGLFCAKPGFAVDATAEHMYLDHEHVNGEEECPEQRIAEEREESPKTQPVEKLRTVAPAKFNFSFSEELPEGALEGVIGTLSPFYTRAIATDIASTASTPFGEAGKGEVFLAGGANVTSVDASGETIQTVSLPGTSPIASGVAVDSQRGRVYVADAANGHLDVLEPAAAAKPTVDSVFPQNLTPEATKIFARIDPNGSPTQAVLEYGTSSCTANPGTCTTVALQPSNLGEGFGDVGAEVELTGLKPNTQYFYRVVAQNAIGTGESSESSTTFFTTLPSAEGLLADHREWEMVSPAVKAGALQLPNDQEPAQMQSAVDGDALTFGANAAGSNGEAAGNRSKQPTQFLFIRNADGWSTQNLTTPHEKGEGFNLVEPPEYLAFSPELSLSLLSPEAKFQFPIESPPLSPPLTEAEKGHQEKSIFLRANSPISPSAEEAQSYGEAAANSGYLAPGYLALLTQVNDTAGNPFAQAFSEDGAGFVGASPNLNHVVIASPVPLLAGVTGQGLYEWNAESPGHELQFVSASPGSGQAALEPQLGGGGDVRNAVSADGSLVFFTAYDATERNEGAHLYMRNTVTQVTTELNAVQGKHSSPNPLDEEFEEIDFVNYQTASSDGSKVFFTDTWPLTDDSRLAPTPSSHPSDLYEYNTQTGVLTDLTVDQHAGQSADVLGVLPGASEDGSEVYFVANGQLADGASAGDCLETKVTEPVGSRSCNLYVSQPDPAHPGERTIKLIARLSNADAPDWGRGVRGPEASNRNDMSWLTSRVSPNGRYLAFMSANSLTGFDNEDATSKSPGERMDQEVFVYDSERGQLACASCNPDKDKRPTGVLDQEIGSGEGERLVIDRVGIWDGQWLAGLIPGWTTLVQARRAVHQPAYLSDNGRVVFDSPDALVPQDTNRRNETIAGVSEAIGVTDVYEYEPSGVGTCAQDPGCASLISSGAGSKESAFVEASATGDDVFFLTDPPLLASDVDSAYDIYDSRVCGVSGSSACLPQPTPPAPECAGEECKAAAPASPSFEPPATATHVGPGNTPATEVRNEKTSKPAPKKLTRAQRLAKALKACGKIKKKKKRLACQKQARKQWGAKKKGKKSSKAKKSSTGGARR
jgi:DNA-binding beta-propeller fold protein YncE